MIRLFRFLRRYTGLILLVFAFVFLQSMANLYLPTLLADIINNGIVKNDQNYILREGGIMLLVTFGAASLRLARRSSLRAWPSALDAISAPGYSPMLASSHCMSSTRSARLR